MPLKSSRKGFLRRSGVSDVSKVKREIQALLRDIVIQRDGGCILRRVRHCTDEVLQADHLITRANSATYANPDLVVCLCRACHGGYKKWHEKEYDALVKTILPKERVDLWEKEEKKRISGFTCRMTLADWKIEKAVLTSILRMNNARAS